MKKILFLIHDLHHGGAEKVLVNLVNNMDPEQFEIHVTALFGGGINEQFLAPHVRFRAIFPKPFPGNSHVMKLFSPRLLHRMFIKERYDVEIAYLEGPAARIISGCTDPDTKTVVWIHCTMQSPEIFSLGFRNAAEARNCYSRFDQGVFVSRDVLEAFRKYFPMEHMQVLYNTNETDKILELAAEPAELPGEGIRWCGMGKLVENKCFDRMLRIQKRLRDEGYPVHFLALGEGDQRPTLEKYVRDNGLQDYITFLGYQTNPYKYVAKCDLFVCASFAEGFSTAATEALIVGTPVCTVEVSGMREMLGENNEWGIVTENDEDALYEGIRTLLDDPMLLEHYKEMAARRGRMFSAKNTTAAAERFFTSLCE